jgi:hypothetical protein
MPTYHLELRQFPRNFNRFNLTGPEIGSVAMTWVQERILDMGDQRWSPVEASMTIIEGPEIPVGRLSMGRGWPTARREGEEVTERVLAEARRALREMGESSAPVAQAAPAPSPNGAHVGDPLALGVELGGLLGADPMGLLAAWRAVAARSSGLTPSESLALAERELASGSGPA